MKLPKAFIILWLWIQNYSDLFIEFEVLYHNMAGLATDGEPVFEAATEAKECTTTGAGLKQFLCSNSSCNDLRDLSGLREGCGWLGLGQVLPRLLGAPGCGKQKFVEFQSCQGSVWQVPPFASPERRFTGWGCRWSRLRSKKFQGQHSWWQDLQHKSAVVSCVGIIFRSNTLDFVINYSSLRSWDLVIAQSAHVPLLRFELPRFLLVLLVLCVKRLNLVRVTSRRRPLALCPCLPTVMFLHQEWLCFTYIGAFGPMILLFIWAAQTTHPQQTRFAFMLLGKLWCLRLGFYPGIFLLGNRRWINVCTKFPSVAFISLFWPKTS